MFASCKRLKVYIVNITPRVSLNINCGLWVLMMCQYMFINCNKWTTLVGDDNGGDWACMETGGVWEISVHFPQFCCERKTALKNIKS